MANPRNFENWISAYLEYSSHSEAPKHMRFWCAVSAIAGALQRKVWIDMAYFSWFPNFYICLVAPPGVVSKSTTAGVAMNLLRRVPGIRFGPEIVTWPALVTAFAESTQAFEYNAAWYTMSAMTLESSEFGNLLNPQDKEMVDLLVTLWDGKQGAMEKKTKHSGNDKIENPWINLIACTTPSWIAGNFPEYMIGGGFTSRTIFVYADKKADFIAYPSRRVPKDLGLMADALVADLTQISKLAGVYQLDESAFAWGEEWYLKHNTTKNIILDDDRFGGYLARKQTHIHKLAMVLAAAEGDNLVITAAHLALAERMVTDLEADMSMVFSKIGRSDDSFNAERLLAYIRKMGKVEWAQAYQYIHKEFPSLRDFEDILNGLIRSQQVMMQQDGGKFYLVAVNR